jgi:DNA repair protein RadA/Sms
VAKAKDLVYRCTACGASYAKWMGRCLGCSAYNTVEQDQASSSGGPQNFEIRARLVKDLLPQSEEPRVSLGIDFLDRILSGGLPPGTAVFLAGEPGIGKSTLLFQLLTQMKRLCLYVSSEESTPQLSRRFRGLRAEPSDKMYLLSSQNLGEILEQMTALKPEIMVLDSIQMVMADEGKVKGGVASLREISEQLVSLAKQLGITLFIVGHVNKDGEIAGPKTLEHLVDTVVTFTMAEDSRHRILQTQKNRYGPSGELVLLEISEAGLKEVPSADSFWTQNHVSEVFGCAIAPVHVGSRIMNVELQALVVQSYFPSPRRSATGFEINRLFLLLAVLEKHLRIPFSKMDVYLNVVGGLRITDPGADLAAAAALISAYYEKPLLKSGIYVGEIGLTGELRPPALYSERLKYAQQAKVQAVIGPSVEGRSKTAAVSCLRVAPSLRDAFRTALEGEKLSSASHSVV